MNLLNKVEIRQKIKSKRRAISVEERDASAKAAAQLLIKHSLFQKSQNIGCYLASEDEFDCQPIIETVWQANKKCYLPVLSPTEQFFLDFALYQLNDPLHPNRYKILEPENKNIIDPKNLDLVIVPLVAFDAKGHRIGMGAGYYDRTFQFLLTSKKSKPVLLGLAYELQYVESLPHDSWDVPLTGILTETRYSNFF